MRKLASIQKIVNLEPIPGADAIEKATVQGWELVVKKGEFKIGELVVYCEVDSILPDKTEFEFLRERKFRIRTIKLRGQISQGICFPLSFLPKQDWAEGDDVTNVLGVKKYDPQAAIEARLNAERDVITKNRIDKFMKRYAWYRRMFLKPVRAGWPGIIAKSDEDRIQLFPNICEEHKDVVFQYSEKMDGQSYTAFIVRNHKKWQFWKPFVFGICSRNFQLLRPDNTSWWTVTRMFDIEKKLKQYIKNRDSKFIAIQGEILGPGVQGNKYKLDEFQLKIFNVVDSGVKYDNESIAAFCTRVGLESVPMLGEMKLLKSIPEMVKFAKGKSTLNPDAIREGIVLRNYEKNISFKVINPDFLLAHDE